MRARWSAYAGISAALAGGVIVKALAQRPNFYSAAVYLSQSSANLMIMTNFIFVAACTLLLGLQKLLYGPLRPIEIEQLYEKAWFAVTETCLAMTIFRGEIGAWFLVMFFALLAGKVWAWIGEGRVEILEQQPPRNPRLFHTRLALSLGLSVLFDLTVLEYVVKQVMRMAKPDMMVMFGFEFAVLSIVSLSTAARYAINLVEIAIVRGQKARRTDEIRRERIADAVREAGQTTQQTTEQTTGDSTTNVTVETTIVPLHAVDAARRAQQQPIDESEVEVEGWEGKGRWIFYLDLTTDFFKLVVYLSFFFILLIFYGLPIHILRDVFMTFRSFFKRIGDFMRYRTATRDMNARYPDATEQDIGSEDVCIICREEMRPYQPPADGERPNPVTERMRPKKLPCGHILHFSCLRSWLERQQICPTCRTNVVSRSSPQPTQTTGAADAAAGQHGNAAPAERQGPRIYQWGPLRIGIGAARGNVMEDLQQQLGDNQPRQGQQPLGDGPQQYGFGIRWDGLRRRDRGDRSSRTIQRQLDDVQRQISQEYRNLGQMTNELRLLRNMETELARIRTQRQGGTASTASAALGTAPIHQGSHNLPAVAALQGNLQNVIPAGSERLPAGLTLPEGWSMMPLQPAQAGFQALGGQNIPGMSQIPSMAPGVPFGLHPFANPQGGMHDNVNQNVANMLQQHRSNQPTDDNPAGRLATVRPQPARSEISRLSSGTTPLIAESATAADQQAAPLDVQRNTETSHSIDPARSVALRSSEPTRSPPQTTENRPQVNGTTEQDGRPTARPAVNSTDDIPVASMFSLPSWGSVPMQASTSNRAVNDTGELDAQRGRSATATSPAANSSVDEHRNGLSSSERKKQNPTVEDLVEEPD